MDDCHEPAPLLILIPCITVILQPGELCAVDCEEQEADGFHEPAPLLIIIPCITVILQPGELCAGDCEEQGKDGRCEPARRQGQRVR